VHDDHRRALEDSFTRDDALAERARRASGAALATLVMQHRDAVYVIARNMCATFRDAEEVLQRPPDQAQEAETRQAADGRQRRTRSVIGGPAAAHPPRGRSGPDERTP